MYPLTLAAHIISLYFFIVSTVDLAAQHQEALLKFISLHHPTLVNDGESFTITIYLPNIAI
jgi:hypothetical protein